MKKVTVTYIGGPLGTITTTDVEAEKVEVEEQGSYTVVTDVSDLAAGRARSIGRQWRFRTERVVLIEIGGATG